MVSVEREMVAAAKGITVRNKEIMAIDEESITEINTIKSIDRETEKSARSTESARDYFHADSADLAD